MFTRIMFFVLVAIFLVGLYLIPVVIDFFLMSFSLTAKATDDWQYFVWGESLATPRPDLSTNISVLALFAKTAFMGSLGAQTYLLLIEAGLRKPSRTVMARIKWIRSRGLLVGTALLIVAVIWLSTTYVF